MLLFPFAAGAQSFSVRQRVYEDRLYLVAEDFKYVGRGTTYFALDMETSKPHPDTALARQLYKGNKGENIPWQGFMQRNVSETKEKRKLVYVRDQQPGSLYYRDIRAFDKILDRDENWLRKKKKEDAKLLYDRKNYTASTLIGFHEATQRYILFSTYGVYAIHQDSLNGPAATIIEYPGFMMLGAVSGLCFSPEHIVLQFDTPPARGRIPQSFFKSFALATGKFSDVSGLDALVDPKCLYSTTSPYLVFYGFGTDRKDWHQRTLLYNLETRIMPQNLRFSLPFTEYKSTLFLHRTLLFEHFSGSGNDIDALRVYDLKNNGKLIYQYQVKR